VAEGDVQEALDDLKRMPLWRKYGSWYPNDVLIAQSKPLVRTPAPAGPQAPKGQGAPGDKAPTQTPTVRQPAPQ
jgi:hypothetical protein